MSDEIRYESKTVRTVRGTENRVISKQQQDGWELAVQEQGTLTSTLTFRRAKKPVPRLLIGAGAVGLVVLAVVIAIGAATENRDGKKDASGKAATPGETASATSTKPSETPSAPTVITVRNNSEFAALIKADYCDEANATFAAKHQNETIAFDGSIVNMTNHGDDTTRFDLLIGPGDKGPKTTAGPAFKYEDVGVSELRLTGDDIPGAIGEGDKFRFVATVGEFNAAQCVFHLDPVSTEVR